MQSHATPFGQDLNAFDRERFGGREQTVLE